MNIQSPFFSFLCKWTLLLALGWTAHGLLRSRDARWRLTLWRGVLCFGLALPLFQFLPIPAVQIPVDKVPQIFSETITLPAPALPASAPTASHRARATSEVQNPSFIRAFSTVSWSDILIAIWVAGALFGAIRLLCFLDQLAALRRAAVPVSPAIQELAAEILRRWQISRSVLVLVSESAVSPFVFGILRPAIMLPAKMAQSLSSEEMAALLGHEVAHLRRRDLWWCVGWRWVKAIFWFHPLIWKLPDVHSLACEEEADRLASSSMESRDSYARVLARLTLRVLALPELETQLAVNGTAQITHRLQRLAKNLGTWNRKQTVGACFLVLAMALVSAGCDMSSKKNDQQIKNAPQQQKRQLTPEQQQGLELMRSYRGKFEQRYGLDVRTHTEAKVVEVENAYQAIERNFGSPECIEAHKEFIKKYPGFNRTGCALSELAGMSEFTNPETEQYYKECIQKYDDCYWGDGVQVGPFARFNLAFVYKNSGQNDKAEALYTEIKDNYPDSIDHEGQLLVDVIKK